MNAETLMLIAAVAGFTLTLYWVRVRDLRERYAVGWILIATLVLGCGLFPGLLMRFANAAHLSYPSAVLFVALGVIYVYAFLVSVSLSRQHRRTAKLLQEFGLLEHRLRCLEQASAHTVDRP